MKRRMWLRGVWALGVPGFALAAASTGCTGLQQVTVRSDWGPGVRFSETTCTYDWSPQGKETSGEGRPRNPNVDPLIREAVERHLAMKGYQKVSSPTPDFWIDYRVVRSRRGDPYFSGPGIGMMEVGSLALYALDPGTQKLIWRGYMEAKLDESAPPDVAKKNLDEAIRRIIEPIPSRKK